ncbi:pyridoxamine 5'-phosphate oxidase [Streptomyces triticagri]|uniref:Pyridoxamine 5'-phosphate oxidase n=1 Tax=Streptomyces triticagri TaxID=2293568 RepID=A0A372LV02_9ACTN|nr:phenazine biosynthesis FMN-dependent oxidase PhzG [Streptomyces triticagri]RFU82498.1 pyridoxamine 5'-phosphate oxidase [Streptomyces triticagri]
MADAAQSAEAQTLSGDASLVLPEFDAPPSVPGGLIREWLASAVARQVREPYAAVLATADAEGRVSSRVLLVKDADDRGLIFTSSSGSRKGQDLAANPWASLTFYWRETLQQLTVQGSVELLGAQESDELFAHRPPAAQAASAVSRQSRPLVDEQELRRRAEDAVTAGAGIARPADWTGYRLVPRCVEFWYGSPDRMHRRLRYDRTDEAGTWSHQRLQP